VSFPLPSSLCSYRISVRISTTHRGAKRLLHALGQGTHAPAHLVQAQGRPDLPSRAGIRDIAGNVSTALAAVADGMSGLCRHPVITAPQDRRHHTRGHQYTQGDPVTAAARPVPEFAHHRALCPCGDRTSVFPAQYHLIIQNCPSIRSRAASASARALAAANARGSTGSYKNSGTATKKNTSSNGSGSAIKKSTGTTGYSGGSTGSGNISGANSGSTGQRGFIPIPLPESRKVL
jgi:hypothetical protein